MIRSLGNRIFQPWVIRRWLKGKEADPEATAADAPARKGLANEFKRSVGKRVMMRKPGLKDTVPERPYHSNLCTSEFH